MQHNEYLNTYFITKDGHKVNLKPLHLEELAKRHRPIQDTLMTRSEVVGHINKGKPVLIALSIEECKEEGQVPLDAKVEKLVRKFKDVIAEDVPLELPPTRDIQHWIDLISGAPLPNKVAYRMKSTQQVELQRHGGVVRAGVD